MGTIEKILPRYRVFMQKFIVKTKMKRKTLRSGQEDKADEAKDGEMSGATVVGKKKSSRTPASLEVLEPSRGFVWRFGKEEHGTAGRSYHYVVRRRLGSDVRAGRRLGSDGSEQFPLARMWTARVSSPHLDGQDPRWY
ncbi:hypothetical protein FNV43_RR18125 [Rhamnella rubrinervis]|uniref:Uncharacterized protein n=1 Tax=Rhamnella rubrinervis TaxID=2594499 RepID=A0A8K0DYF6_9ROSA|nr:hypothetical protein FNV43_RR18125 [Rhamnella rubrinervis]